MQESRAANNRTITLENSEIEGLKRELLTPQNITSANIVNKILCGDTLDLLKNIPDKFADLIIIDPPY
ncbi:MAG: site-specific DNA-methyltransferase, partial [Paludibacteraceae bacterium]|nr:site-specific DNA-methyltransferase [Paludibacteraceae bacterium]